MASLNSCCFTGNLCKDAESKVVGENEVATFRIAVNGRGDDVIYLTCDMWRPGGVTEYLVRGKAVAVQGILKCRQYEKDGLKRDFWSLDVKGLTLMGGAREPEPAF